MLLEMEALVFTFDKPHLFLTFFSCIEFYARHNSNAIENGAVLQAKNNYKL